MKNDMMEDKPTRQAQLYFAVASLLLIAGFVICAAIANIVPDSVVWIVAISVFIVDVIFWIMFFKKQGWFASRHTGGGSSVK